MNEPGKSDRPIVPKKSPNKTRTPAAEEMEGRGLAKGNLGQQNAPRTQSRISAPSELAQIRQTAKSNKDVKFTALMHHIYRIDTLRFAYSQLKRHAAAGVDGETWQHYGEDLEANLQDLSHRLKRGAYRAKPVRRVYIPKADGRQRPLGVPALEDKLVQRAAVEVLNNIYETDFLGFSYGFRPKRSQHKALDALWCGLHERRVNWVLDLDVRSFFDRLSHEWLVRFLQHRIADRRVVRLIQKWLNAGVLEKGKRTQVEAGSPQGGSASPLLANIYLHYVFDLWIQAWRKKCARGDVIVVRYADDIVVGFEFKDDAERFWAELKERMQKFQLELHPEKTRLIEFGAMRRRTVSAPAWASLRPSTSSASSTSAGRRRREGSWCFGTPFASACSPRCCASRSSCGGVCMILFLKSASG
jgi:RNA-directed DNA polymerase